jgi:hypothetical protein
MKAIVRSRRSLLRCVAASMLLLPGVLAFTSGAAHASDRVQLQVGHTGQCIHVNIFPIDGGTCLLNTDTNILELQPSDNGTYRLVKLGTNKCLGVYNGSLSPGTVIVLEGCNSNWRQQWWINDNGYGNNWREFANRRSELCLEIPNVPTAANPWLALQQSTCTQGTNQWFRTLPV